MMLPGTVKVGNEVTNQASSVFSDYLTDLTNLVEGRATEQLQEEKQTLEEYSQTV